VMTGYQTPAFIQNKSGTGNSTTPSVTLQLLVTYL
jgi:hypothetical protein